MGNLISLTDVKSYLQITNTASDTLLDIYIEAVEAEVAAYVDRNLALNTYTEVLSYLQSTFDQTGHTFLDAEQPSPNLFLENTPVNTVTSFIDGGVAKTNYRLDTSRGVISADYQFDEPTVTYVAGYTSVTAPAALQLVIMQGVGSIYTNNKAATQGSGNVKSKSIKDFSVSYGNVQNGYVTEIGGELMKNYLASNSVILNRYKRVRI